MKFDVIEGINTFSLNLIATLALSVLLLMLGYSIRGKVKFLQKFCIPAPVIGGLLFSILVFVLRQNKVAYIQMDTVLQTPLMIMFFTTVGITGSFKVIKKGGKILIIYWVLTSLLAVTQNFIGLSIAKLTDINPMFGIMAGSVSMIGGHGGAAAFGETAEKIMGVSGSIAVAMAAATFGLISGSLIGGPIARFLIERYKLKPEETSVTEEHSQEEESKYPMDYAGIMFNLTVIVTIMVIGSVVSDAFTSFIKSIGLGDIVLPAYVGAMFVAIIFRNVNDKFHWFDLDYKIIDIMGDVSLGIFLSMALMTLKLWELIGVAGPLFIILFAQVIFLTFYTIFIVFRLCGKDFDAAIMVSGMCGHGLGATPNAMANMNSVTSNYGYSAKAFLIVPLVGSFLVDVVNIPNVLTFMNFIM
ncbi:sodium/glutamate symporter [Soehngenia saccharolytica]|nr:sodium/glutamate symporter [Soehngenia saccharolytica]